ncbi:hypothetical protein [Planctomycetes bacterium TBK1r]|uniref:Uncharacterized protein n=1 Tax=Stieleria magnilauensis TaxID=2527963 RepID=A0ABX5Y0V3_9BACT|nr:hypothetical protein TBK1r_47200 [Planctomycetes bacterium TBK1r]
MKRIHSLMVTAVAIGCFAFASDASADHFNGRYGAGYGGYGQAGQQFGGSGCSAYGQGGYGSAYRGGYSSGYSRGPIQSHAPNYGYGGGSYGVAPGYRSGYAPSNYTPRNHGARGGIHLDIGRFHVLGVGGRH